MNSYHDIYITTENIDRIAISNLSFGYQLRCCRVGGWEFWYQEKLVASEFGDEWLVIECGDNLILDSRPEEKLPDDMKWFLKDITLFLQQHRSKSPEQISKKFQDAYQLYVKYKVDEKYD